MLQHRKGFTLIELMIVVAIIGILAAVAVPGFLKYIKDSKTTEAKTNIKAIAEGASAFFQTEHGKDTNGIEVFTRQFPSATYCKSLAGGGKCLEKDNQPSEIQSTGTKKVGTWTGEPWLSLNFTISAPIYYTYSYQGTAGSTNATSFKAQAAAKLDKTTVDSCFSIEGKQDDSGELQLGSVVDKSEAETACTTF